MNFDQLTGRTRTHLTWSDKLEIFIHPPVENDLVGLKNKAWENGFDLQVASGFRDFQRQKLIWNEKAQGKRPVLGRGSSVGFDLAKKILTWSALPGASRHHWGTDFDLYCLNSLPLDYKLKLTPEEFGPGGVLSSFGIWLQENLKDFDFFCPYQEDKGGVLPEPWHLAHGPSSVKFMESYTLPIFEKNLQESDLELSEHLLKNGPKLYKNYFKNISLNPWNLNSIS